MKSAFAHIDTTVIMGGVTICVAENVVVKSRSTTILGGFEDKTRPHTEQDSPTPYIDGTVVLGGIEIKR